MIVDGIGKKNEMIRKNCNELERELGLNGIEPSPAQGWGQIQLKDPIKFLWSGLCTYIAALGLCLLLEK